MDWGMWFNFLNLCGREEIKSINCTILTDREQLVVPDYSSANLVAESMKLVVAAKVFNPGTRTYLEHYKLAEQQQQRTLTEP